MLVWTEGHHQEVLGELDTRRQIPHLRMRSPALIRHSTPSAGSDDHAGPARPAQPARVHEDKAVKLTSYQARSASSSSPASGDAATIIITNEHHAGPEADQPVRPPHDHRAAPGRDHPLLCADALSSTVNLNVDLDIMLCVWPGLLAASGPGSAPATPPPPRTPQRRFLDSSGTITTTGTRYRPHRPPRLLTRPTPGQPPARHHRPLVARPTPALRVQLIQGRRSCMEIGVRPGERPVCRRSTAAGRGAQRGFRGVVPRASTATPAFRPGERPVCRRVTAAGRGAQRGFRGIVPGPHSDPGLSAG